MNILNKKINIWFLLVVYGLSFVLNQAFFIDFKKVFAEENISKTNIVAVVVDKDVYAKHESDIKWYASEYVQKNVSNSKAIVLPINTKNLKAWDITKMLENIYFDGIEGESSKLDGLVLMGDIPMPVVNNKGYLFPSIYPYVDFEEQKYVFDQKSNFFVLNSDDIGQAEVWHGWIKFQTDEDYKNFFLRLRKYDKDPSSFVLPRMWYDDFVFLKKNFLTDNLPYYTNNFVFAEDNSYHRYTNLFSDILKSDYSESSLNIGKDLSADLKNSEDPDLKEYADKIGKLAAQTDVSLDSFQKMGTPTLLLKESIGNFVKPYVDLISAKYLSQVRDNLEASSRRYRKNSSGEIVNSIEGHYEKITKQDSWLLGNDQVKSIFVELNDFMEKKINDQIEKEKYYLDIPLIVSYNNYENNNKSYILKKYCETDTDNFYYNFYFGKNALNITGISDTSIYNGKYLNYSSLSGGDNIQVDIQKSIAGSYGIFSQQTESNRGYNIFNIEPELEYRSGNRIPEKWKKECVSHFSLLGFNLFCKQKGYAIESSDPKEDPNYFAIRNRGGASPLNLDGSFALKSYDYKNSWLPIYDLGGTKNINKEEPSAYSYLGVDTFGSMILVNDRYGEMNYPKILNGAIQDVSKTRLASSSFSIFDLYKSENGVAKVFNLNMTGNIIKNVRPVSKKYEISKLSSPCSDYPAAKIYDYKTISSIKYNVSPTVKQVDGMNLTTFDRPVDSERNVTFKGVGGGLVKFDYPNIFQVQVYNSISGNLVLKPNLDISNSISQYLKKSVDKFNFQLKNQSSQKNQYFGQYSNAFGFLASSDALASPNRNYQNFSDTFLEDTLVEFFDNLSNKYGYEKIYGEKIIKTKQDKINFLSELLYRLNQNVYSRKYQTSVREDLNQIRENFDVNTRVSSAVKTYLKKYDEGILLSPDFNRTGYEVAFINSDGDNYLSSENIPSFISQLDSIKNKNDSGSPKTKTNTDFDYKNTSDINDECGGDAAGTVLLFDIKKMNSPWFDAMKCWLKKVAKKPFEIKINFDNALGPVFVPGGTGFFGLKDSKDQYINEAQKHFEVLDNGNKGDPKNNNLSWETNQKLQKIKSYININSESSSFFVTEEKKKVLGIYSSVDLGRLDVTVSLTGDNCFGVKGSSSNLCNEKILFSSNIFETPKELEIDMKNKKSGFDALILKICLPYSSDCVEKQKVINLMPGTISDVSFLAPSKRVLPGAEIPIKVIGKDKYENLISQTLRNFNISVLSGDGEFYYDGAWSNNISFQNFKDSDFIFRAAKDINKSIINIVLSGNNEDNVLINKELPISVVKGKLDIAYEGTILSNNTQINYDLARKGHDLYFTGNAGVKNLDAEKLLKLSLKLQDQNGVYLDSVAKVYSQNGLVFPGFVSKDQAYYDGKRAVQYTFISQKDFILSGGKVDIFFHPNFKAGKDKIILQIPGFDDFVVNVSVLAGEEKRISLEFPKTNIELGKGLSGTLKIFDERGNLLDRGVSVKMGTMGSIKLDGTEDKTINGVGSFSLKDIGLVGEGYFYAVLKNVSLDGQIPGYQKVIVQEDLLPKEKLNVMYLNLFGSDWGNQRGYFSDNNEYINEIFGKAEKTLAVTTQMVDINKVKKTDLIVDQNAQIKNIGGLNSSIVLQSGYINYSFDNVGYINIGKQSDFGMSSFIVQKKDNGTDIGFFGSLFNKKTILSTGDSVKIQKESYINDSIKDNKNVLIYFPEDTDSVVKTNVFDKGKIIVNDNVVVDFSDSNVSRDIKIVLSESRILGYSVFDIIWGSKRIGQLFVWRGDEYILGSSIKIYDAYRYVSQKIFADGSTNGKKGIGIIDLQSKMEEKNISIESSYQDDLGIGFQSPFKNITLFGQGKSVGQSTLAFASEFLINFGDPVLKRISDNVNIDKTPFDAGIGQVVFSDTSKQIFKTLLIDFNNDGLKDILIVYKDGTVKLQKNYGGGEFDKNLQDLFLIEGGIRDVFVGDVDGNKYQDVIVRNNKNKMIVYKNNYGIFDIDGSLVCLNTNADKGYITNTPDDLSDVSQIFLKDMDLDGSVDIITNDYDGYIKVFYGGSNSKKGSNYISSLDYSCDSQWYARQRDNEVLVKNYGIYLDSESFLQDTSLVRWNGFNPYAKEAVNVDNEVEADAQEYDNYDSPYKQDIKIDQTKSLLKSTLAKVDTFMEDLPNKIDPNALGDDYVSSPIDYTPINERMSDQDLYYIPIKYLSGEDKISVYKKYKDLNGGNLKKGDEVLITVTLLAKQAGDFTYFEEIKGPWLVPTTEDRSIKTFSFGSGYVSPNIKINRSVEPYQFMLDNVILNAGESLVFSYKVYYNQTNTPVNIGVKDIALPDKNLVKDGYNEIAVNSNDSCLKGRYIYKSQNRSYTEIFDDVQSRVSAYLEEMDKKQGDILKDSVSGVGDVGSLSDVNKLIDSYGGTKEKRNVKSILQSLLEEGGASMSFNLDFMDNVVAKASENIDKALGGLCNGFSLGKGGGCSGMPLPFNQAFLAPGKYHLFGCFNLPLTPLDKGVPVLSFPTNVPLIPIRPPSPAGAGGIFGGVGSMFRLYVSPTLTLGLGLAMCVGPYSLGIRLPKPFRDIVGNCVVVALPPLSTKCKAAGQATNTANSVVTDSFDDYLVDLGDNGACNKGDVRKGEADGVGGKITTTESAFRLQSGPKVFEGNFGGIMRFDQEPYSFVQKDSNISFEGIGSIEEEKGFSLSSNEKITLKILSSKIKGLVKCIVQDWEVRQIKYIVNNLTKMNVNLTLPDLSAIGDGISNIDLGNISNVLSDIKKEKKDEGYTKQLTGINRYLSNQSLDNLSSSFDNPFETILALFDKVPLVNMETKDINIKVPLLTIDQMSSYSAYLKLWIEKNDKILQKWDVAIEEMLNVCGVENKNKAKELIVNEKGLDELLAKDTSESCHKALESLRNFVKFKQDTEKLIYSVKQNINILEEYKKFPFKLYEWIHITDRYVTETVSFVSNFLGKLTFRLNTNATRFSQYIDSMTILVHAIKTRQVIIDFSLDRSEKCSKCSNDNYSSYSCSLSFLCPKLPILPIPPFKIPNISLDLSHLDLGVDILLPKFSFSPINIALPKIPDLPYPPEYGITITFFDIPSIPVLPNPPELPELPSFIPNVEVQLPTLPPAPKIPNISPKIEVILKVAKFIGKIFCIVKGGIGLVGEKGVKAKIEQMTQRTWNVPIFDYFDLTTKYRDPPLKGFDRKLDAYLELRYNFDGVYNFINSVSSYVNGFSNNIQNKAAESVNNAEDWSANKIEDVKTNIKDNIIKGSYIPSKSSEANYEDYNDVYKSLKDGINYFKLYAKDDKKTSERLDKIAYNINNKSNISINTDNINKIKQDVNILMEQKKGEYKKISDKILDNYDGFISDLKLSGKLISDKSDKIKFETKLVNIDDLNRDILSKQESPAKSYIALNSQFVDGYLSAVENNSPVQLNMTQDTYDKSKNYLLDLKNKISRTNDVQLYSQSMGSCPTCGSSTKLALASSSDKTSNIQYKQDVSIYTKGIYLDSLKDGKVSKTNLIQSKDQIEKIGDNYFFEDINNDKKEDLLMWDEGSIYVKYADQDSNYYAKNGKNINKSDSKYYLYSNLKNKRSIDDLSDMPEDGIAEFNSTKIKIFDQNLEVKNFAMKGQSFENLKFSFTNSNYLGDEVDGYVIRLNKRIDTFFDKYQISNFLNNDLLSSKYIIILPSDKYTITGTIVSFDSISKKPLKSLMTGTILGVRYFDLDQDTVSLVLNEVDRSRQYAQIAALKMNEDGLGFFTSSKYTLLKQSSPWSNQILGGRQIISDDKGPSPVISVYRPSVKKVISTGNFHELYVSTFYNLNINRTDDVAVSEMWIAKNGKIMKRVLNNSKDGFISLENLNFTGADKIKFEVGARDFNNNISTQEVELDVAIPDIKILSVDKINDKVANIVAEISHDLDWGMVSFEKMINSTWNIISGINSNNGGYGIVPGQTIIDGGNFDLSNFVGFHDTNGVKFANIDPTNGAIKIFDEYIFKFDLRASFINNFINVSIFDKQKNENKFNIKLPSENLIGIQLLQGKPYYDVVKLYGNSFGAFNDGYCIKNMSQDCIMYISLSGYVYSPSMYANDFGGDYEFNYTGNYVKYYLKDQFGKGLLNLNIKTKSLLK